jgi:TRAP-type mannitol/chloroaromatic compound transport system permease small subunit
MQGLLRLSRLIDGLNGRVGRSVYWLVLLAVLVSAGNALVRKMFNVSSNAFLELQWYLFSAVFLLCGGYALLSGSHVRIDVILGRFSRRTQVWVDVLGTIFFLLPTSLLLLYLSWPVFLRAVAQGEVSMNAGGLPTWPARLLVPVGFALLTLQGLSELVKRIAFLRGLIPDPDSQHAGKSAEEELAEEIRKLAEAKA